MSGKTKGFFGGQGRGGGPQRRNAIKPRPMVVKEKPKTNLAVVPKGGFNGKVGKILGAIQSSRKWTFIFPKMNKRMKVENSSTKIVHMGPYTPDTKIVPSEIHMIQMPYKSPIKTKLLPQTPVWMAKAQTSAKFIPQKKKNKEKKL